MSDDKPALEQTARQLIARDGSEAAVIAREAAERADGIGDLLSAETWRDIADEVERLQRG